MPKEKTSKRKALHSPLKKNTAHTDASHNGTANENAGPDRAPSSFAGILTKGHGGGYTWNQYKLFPERRKSLKQSTSSATEQNQDASSARHVRFSDGDNNGKSITGEALKQSAQLGVSCGFLLCA